MSDTALLHQLDVPTPTLEGYLFPDTYIFAMGTTARAAVTTMVKRFEQVWKPEWTARLDTLHLSRNDVMALASIVEKEARVAQERPVIAAVYLNRLRHGMLLQADPTVQFVLGKHVARVYYKDLEIDSPYNTYKHKGLPPGPIASPGKLEHRGGAVSGERVVRVFRRVPRRASRVPRRSRRARAGEDRSAQSVGFSRRVASRRCLASQVIRSASGS